jgi:hypothetical protein
MPGQIQELPDGRQRAVLLPANVPLGFATKGNVLTQDVMTNVENWWPATADLGSLEVVPGFDTFGAAGPGGAGRLTMIAGGEKASTQTRRYFVSGDTSTWLLTTNGTATEVKTGLATDSYHTVVSFGDVMCFFPYDTATAPYKYDFSSDTASAITDIGLTQPTLGGATSVTNGEGNVKGIVKYFVAYVSGTSVLALSAAFGEVNAGDGSTIDLSSIPTSSTHFRYIYRTRANGEQPYFVGSIDDSTTTTFSDNALDRELSEVPPQHGQPPPAATKYAVVYNNRLYIAGATQNLVDFSDINNPDSFNTFSFYSIGGKDGDEITGLAKIRGALIIFKRNHMYKITGRDPEIDMIGVDSVRSDDPNSRAVGCPDQGALCGTPEGIFFYFNRNFYMLSNQCTIQNLTQQIENELQDDINQAEEENIRCFYDPNRRIVYASVPTGSSTYPDRTYLYFLDLQAWYKMTVGFTAGHVVEIGTDGSPPDSFQIWAHYNEASPIKAVQRLDHPTATDFDGDAIVAQAEWPPLSFGAPGDLTHWSEGTVTYDVLTTTTDLQLRYNLYSKTSGDVTISVDLQKSGFARWTRRFGLGWLTNELKLLLYWPGGTERPVVHGVTLTGGVQSTEAHL